MTNYLIMVCMMCQRPYGIKPTLGESGISHGYCVPCGAKKIEETLKEIDALKQEQPKEDEPCSP